jgi:hypothetical protein
MLPIVTDDEVTPVESWKAAEGIGARPCVDADVVVRAPPDVVDEQAVTVAMTIRSEMGTSSRGEWRRRAPWPVSVSVSVSVSDTV